MALLIDMWKRFTITLAVKNRVVGGIPTNPELIKGWVAANMPDISEEEKAKLAAATASQLPEMTEEKADGMYTTFKRDELGIYFEGRNVKSMLKECANILREKLIASEKKNAKAVAVEPPKPEGEEKDKPKGKKEKAEKVQKSRFTNLKARLAERIFVEEDKIRFIRDGKPLMAVDGDEERAIHVMTAQGPRTALKRCDFVNAPCELSFTVRVMDDGLIDSDLIETLLEFGGWNGLGADRSQGNGMFELKGIKPVETSKAA